MITAQQIHIQIDNSINANNSHKRQTLEPEEKDWLFNNALLKYIKNKVNPTSNRSNVGFEENLKRYEDFEELLTSVEVPLFYYDDSTLMGYQPANCLHIIPKSGIRIKSASNCPFNIADFDKTLTGHKIFVLSFPTATSANSQFYKDFTITTNLPSTIFTIAGSLKDYYIDADERFFLIQRILESINREYGVGKIQAFWQRFDSYYYPNSIIFYVEDGSAITSMTCTYKTDVAVTATVPLANPAFVKYRYNIENFTEEYPARVVKNEILLNLLNFSFGSTKLTNPIVSLKNRQILVHHKKRFISMSANVTFLKNPQKINLNLNIHSELDETTVLEVIDLGVADFLSALDGENYKKLINQNLLNE